MNECKSSGSIVCQMKELSKIFDFLTFKNMEESILLVKILRQGLIDYEEEEIALFQRKMGF